MKKRFILLLLIIFLPACGGLSSVPGGEPGAISPGTDMPLPDSEKTRLADQVPTFPVPGTELPSATIEPGETQINQEPTWTLTGTATETTVPSSTMPPTATQVTQVPSLTPSLAPSDTPITSPTLAPSATTGFTTPTVTLISTQTSPALITATPSPVPTQTDQLTPPRTLDRFLASLKFFLWPGGLCLVGLLFMALAGAMFYFQRRKTRPVRRGLKLGDLDPGWGSVQVNGVISQIPHRLDMLTPFPLDGKNASPLAVIRLAIEEYDVDNGIWNPLRDEVRATQFLLDDGTGTAWIDPNKQTVQLIGNGIIPSIEQVRAALDILRLPPQLVKGERLRFRLWVLRAGETVNVMAQVQPRPPVLVTMDDWPLVLSPQNGNPQYRSNEVRSYTSVGVMAVGLAFAGLCISGGALAIILSRLW